MFPLLSEVQTFAPPFDVVVVGAGCAGYAAATCLRSAGRRVLLVDPDGALLWEAGRAFGPHLGQRSDPHWRELVNDVAQRGGLGDNWLDGAIAEVVATHRLMERGVECLYFAHPVALEWSGDHVEAMTVATKAGLRRVIGKAWVDATEHGSLFRLLNPAWRGREPDEIWIHLNLQHADWSELPIDEAFVSTAWPTQRVWSTRVDPIDGGWRAKLLGGLEDVAQRLGDAVGEVSLSHMSTTPLGVYRGGADEPCPPLMRNLASASPAATRNPVRSLADRFGLGIAAAELAVESLSDARDVRAVVDQGQAVLCDTLRADVCVVGVGTGGVMAAVAAARAGAQVLAIEPGGFAGGIGVGGGIHSYYWGVRGGLQQTLDERVRSLMKRFATPRGDGPLGDGPFNPWAKMVAVEQLLEASGVDLRLRTMPISVERTQAGKVTALFAVGPNGLVRIEADGFIDSTGDGDLSALAGAAFELGRPSDGLLHAYSQAAGRLRVLRGRPRMQMVNFDVGCCDPTDPIDLTRARLYGVRSYLLDRYENQTRPTYLAPSLGIRQGRQIATRQVMTLDDQISGRRFEEPIGYMGCHYDNHAVDYEFEADEVLFWVWANRGWETPLACQISYGMIVPIGLQNVWIGSRCLGVTHAAHAACRMQRDVQRVGEAAGYAAALASQLGCRADRLPYATLRAKLDETKALATPREGASALFNPDASGQYAAEASMSLDDALAALDDAQCGRHLWWLYRRPELAQYQVLKRLDSPRREVSWLAATVAAMWEHPAAQPRLLEAIERREYGFDEADSHGALRGRPVKHPLNTNRLVPNWLSAAALLRCCGDATCLPSLAGLASMRPLGLTVATTIALTIARLAKRSVIDGCRWHALDLLEQLLEAPLVGVMDRPDRNPGYTAELAARAGRDTPADSPRPRLGEDWYLNIVDDHHWQLHLAIADARWALGLEAHERGQQLQKETRPWVRRAYAVAAARRSEMPQPTAVGASVRNMI